jgi:magnesium-transporting ATPase (P-type)
LTVAGAAWWMTGNPIRFLSVVVIATPCPLLIAIPVAIIGAISTAARRGVIVKDPAALEQLTRCRTMILDKTGTLTYGRLTMVNTTRRRSPARRRRRWSRPSNATAAIHGCRDQGPPKRPGIPCPTSSGSEETGESLDARVRA